MKRILAIVVIGAITAIIVGLPCALIGAMLVNNTFYDELHWIPSTITTWQFFKAELILDCLSAVVLLSIRLSINKD